MTSIENALTRVDEVEFFEYTQWLEKQNTILVKRDEKAVGLTESSTQLLILTVSCTELARMTYGFLFTNQ